MNSYRLVTRSDFDGIVCAALLKEVFPIEEIAFAHPKDVQDGKLEFSGKDITANLPYVPSVFLSFDHHVSESLRVKKIDHNRIIEPEAKSAARVIYNHFGGNEKYPRIPSELMDAVDRADSADFTIDDVLKPEGWILLSFIMDSRTGLGRVKDFRISNYELMMKLIDQVIDLTIDQIMDSEDVRERSEVYFKQQDVFKTQIRRCSTTQKNVLIVDLRDEETIFTGNRFLKYAMHPETNISVQVIWGKNRVNTVINVGKSILLKTSQCNIGELMLRYGGGGHANAGACQVRNEDSKRIIGEIIENIAE
jgi:nanoRNase/pAp phosphatase (c-di-AMP/oligoRNAs hydrolase)